MLSRRDVVFPLLAAILGCGGPSPENTAYVLIEEEARAAGYGMSAGAFQGSPVLPIAVDLSQPAFLTGPKGRVPLELRRGSLTLVRGAGGNIDWAAIGRDIRADRFVVKGSESSAKTLAALLDAQVERRGDQRWALTAPDVYDRASYMGAEVKGAEPEAGGEPAVVRSAPDLSDVPSRLSVAAPAAPKLAAASPARSITAVVGAFSDGKRLLLLDTSGGFTLSSICGGAAVSSGSFGLEGDFVVLTPARGVPTVLAQVAAGGLRDPYGQVFQIMGGGR